MVAPGNVAVGRSGGVILAMRPVFARYPRENSRQPIGSHNRWDHGPTLPNRTVTWSDGSNMRRAFAMAIASISLAGCSSFSTSSWNYFKSDPPTISGSAGIDPARRRCAHLARARLQDPLFGQRDAAGGQHQLPGELFDARQTAGRRAGPDCEGGRRRVLVGQGQAVTRTPWSPSCSRSARRRGRPGRCAPSGRNPLPPRPTLARPLLPSDGCPVTVACTAQDLCDRNIAGLYGVPNVHRLG